MLHTDLRPLSFVCLSLSNKDKNTQIWKVRFIPKHTRNEMARGFHCCLNQKQQGWHILLLTPPISSFFDVQQGRSSLLSVRAQWRPQLFHHWGETTRRRAVRPRQPVLPLSRHPAGKMSNTVHTFPVHHLWLSSLSFQTSAFNGCYDVILFCTTLIKITHFLLFCLTVVVPLQHLLENGHLENIFSDPIFKKFSVRINKILKGFKPAAVASGESSGLVFLRWINSGWPDLNTPLSSPLQVSSIPVWRRSSCGTVNSWGRTPPSSSSTLCSSSAASTLASPQLSSTGSFPSPTSGAAPKPTRTTPRPASCASTRQNPFTRQSQVPIWLRLKLKWLYCNIIEFRF